MDRTFRVFLSLLLPLFFLFTQAQAQLPGSSLFLMDYEIAENKLFFRNPKFISGFNVDGYNNQPAFFLDHHIYIATNKYDPESTEIAMLNIIDYSMTRITKTRESEFSPTLTPDGKYFTTVRIERDGKDQSLWQYPLDRSSYGIRLLPELKNIGYHLWLSNEELGLFLVDDPVTLSIVNVNTGQKKTLLDNIGRCMKLSRNKELIIIHKLNPDSWFLKSYDLTSGRFKIITQTIPGAEDFLILNDGSILMASGSAIWRYRQEGISGQWQMVDDFADLGIKNINRMAISGGKIVIVSND